jgi:hypothetical protein
MINEKEIVTKTSNYISFSLSIQVNKNVHKVRGAHEYKTRRFYFDNVVSKMHRWDYGALLR